MTYNPPLNTTGEPFRVANEHLICTRGNVEFSSEIQGGGKSEVVIGRLILTTVRLVFVNEGPGDISAFDIPHFSTSKEQFTRPWFGSRFWEGQCLPISNNLPGRVSWKIQFGRDGYSAFNQVYREVLQKTRNKRYQWEIIQDYNNEEFVQNFASIDSSDPSIIYEK